MKHTKDKELIEILENMLHRMVEGFLGCSGFNMVETDALRTVIKALSSQSKQIEELKKKKGWVICPECNNEDMLKIRCTEKEPDGTLTYKCHKCKNKFKINETNELLLKTIEDAKKEYEHQLQTQRDEIFKEIEKGITDLDTKYVRQYFKDTWEETAVKWSQAYDKLENTIKHLKQKHKGDDINGISDNKM